MNGYVHWFLRERKRRQRILGLIGVEEAPPYVEPDEEPIAPPAGDPVPPGDTLTDPETDEPEPGIDPDFTAADRIEVVDAGQGVQRTQTDPGTWGNSYVAALLTGPEYWEVLIQNSTPVGATMAFGVSTLDMPLNGIPGALAGTIAYWSNGEVRQNGAVIATLSSYGRGDRIGISYDTDGSVRFFKNCAPLNGGDPVGTVAGSVYPFAALYSASARMGYRFSLSRFGCTVPAGFHPIGQVPVQIFVEDFEGEQQFFESGYALKHVQTSNGRRAMSWDVVPDATDVEVLARIVLADAYDERFGVIVRGAGSGGSETGYVWQINNPVSDSERNLIKYVSGSFTDIADAGDPEPLTARRYWLRFRVNGTSLQGKTWYDGEDEPLDWDIEESDSSISAAGWVGLFSFNGEGYGKYCEYFATGINGASAPAMGAAPGPDQYATDFSEADANGDWANRWSSSNVTRSVVTTADDILPLDWDHVGQTPVGYRDDENGTYIFKDSGSSGALSRSWSFNKELSYTNFDAVFIVEGTRSSFGSTMAVFRSSRSGCYAFGLHANGPTATNRLALRRFTLSGLTTLEDESFDWDLDQEYFCRVRCEGDQIKARLWPVGGMEPETWFFDIVDSVISDGSIGFGFSTRLSEGRLKYVAVSSDPNTPAPLPE